MKNEEIKVGYNTRIDLKECFPISRRYALRKTLAWALFLLPFIIICHITSLQSNLDDQEKVMLAVAQYIAIGVLFCKYLYAELYRISFNYVLEGFRVIISRGVILKKIGSLPLLPVTEVYIQKNIVDILCGIANVDILTAMDDTGKFTRIECLTRRDARKLQKFIGDLLMTQVFIAPAAEENKTITLTVSDDRPETNRNSPARLPGLMELPANNDGDLPIKWNRPLKN